MKYPDTNKCYAQPLSPFNNHFPHPLICFLFLEKFLINLRSSFLKLEYLEMTQKVPHSTSLNLPVSWNENQRNY